MIRTLRELAAALELGFGFFLAGLRRRRWEGERG